MHAYLGLAGGAVAVVLVVLAVALSRRRRRRPEPSGRDAALRVARQAIRQSRRDQRRRGHEGIRGRGYGGDDSVAGGAASGSESGGMP
ncbi:hypothetical protein AB0J20_04085 [Micromonospora costi]|uniref:hypothetical protein n=1 Tax=Micromonospora costi TaxID=1530042 RepID=UPI0033D346C7